MKKTYISPEINLAVFRTENVVTVSGVKDISAADYMKNNAADIFGSENAEKATAIIVL